MPNGRVTHNAGLLPVLLMRALDKSEGKVID